MNIQEVLNKETLSYDDIHFLLGISSEKEMAQLFQKARAVKQLFLGRIKSKILCIQISNHCENNCLYCELREDSISVTRFRLTPDEVLEKVNSFYSSGITNIIIQSGADSYYDTDMISYLIYKLKQEYDVEITLDLLQRRFDEYRAWKFAGADNYLLKFNTSNQANFSLFTQESRLDERINHINYLKRIGYKICTGNIIGLPFQTNQDLVKDLLMLKALHPEMIFNTPFTPQNLTKFQNSPKGDFQLLLKITAITRLILKKSQLIVSTSNNLFSVEEKKRLFEIGADTLMLEPMEQDEFKSN